MTAPYLGGLRITGAVWLSPRALRVAFSSSYGTSYDYQLYAGRTLAGSTSSPSQRVVIGQVIPSAYPQHLTIVAVPLGQASTDYGASLPLRPYNRVRLRFRAESYPADAKFLDVTAGTEPGGAVSASNRIARVPYDTDREYIFTTDPLSGTGTWNFEVAGVDNRPSDGNAGTALALSAAVLAHPPDVTPQSDGNRLTASVSGGTATVGFTIPS